ncbi:hypothetical protein BT96DRAFT_414103 [Gymnopus androsaceus JB14]|uniref:F-box domain-containing protein n=1 Tax=Gymnopus androsaceus JB14 TaxID=1447944 RepID=A0A6A4GVF3_9AGAR|nr:hypothetical protein BT96DRAFT_414103 [Gymnopus androsaceus JB14]
MKCSQCSCETEKELPAFLPPFNRTTLDRLRAGYVPKSSVELSDIETFLQSAESSLADYEEDIQRLERTKRLREETIRAMHNARTLTSPIRKVPPEILCEIFANYICDSAFESVNQPTQTKREPLVQRFS